VSLVVGRDRVFDDVDVDGRLSVGWFRWGGRQRHFGGEGGVGGRRHAARCRVQHGGRQGGVVEMVPSTCGLKDRYDDTMR